MRLSITHRTTYMYSRPVFLDPHFLRLRPRSDPAQEIAEYVLTVSPEPAGRSHGLDPEGNWLTCLWFNDLVEKLELTAGFAVETRRSDPFDFLLTTPGFSAVTSPYPEHLRARLGPTLVPLGCDATVELVRTVLPCESLVDFLWGLNRTVHERCRVIVREWGDPWPPARTLAEGCGACRDLAVVFIEGCRSVGIAARFASGFVGGDTGGHSHFLHAWAEAYLPGAGWRGFDPTHGLAVTDQHVCVAASSSHHGAIPVSGTFRGTDATSTLETEIRVDCS
ncbi:MAG: transglutaminase family protein [Deferrisomatales bacterium]|nr:transglutaminase family protein [Deferrisomatales bacterium]